MMGGQGGPLENGLGAWCKSSLSSSGVISCIFPFPGVLLGTEWKRDGPGPPGLSQRNGLSIGAEGVVLAVRFLSKV